MTPSSSERTFNLADLFEVVADAAPDRIALVAGDVRHTYAALDERANRLAHHLMASGIEPGDWVGIYSWNRAEWVEAMIACYKARRGADQRELPLRRGRADATCSTTPTSAG